MPYRDKPIEKAYFSILEMSNMLRVAQSCIRYWEGQFYWVKPKQNGNRVRFYSLKNVEDLLDITYMKKEMGASNKAIIESHKYGYIKKMIKMHKDHLIYTHGKEV